MAVKLRTPDDLTFVPEQKKKKKGPFGLSGIGRVLAGVASGGTTELIGAIPEEKRAPILAIGGALAGGIAGGPAGASGGFSAGQQAAGLDRALSKEELQPPPTDKRRPEIQPSAVQRRVSAPPPESNLLAEGMLAAQQLPDPIQRKEALDALFPAFVKINRRSNV